MQNDNTPPINGEAKPQQPVKMHPIEAVWRLSEAFLQIMAFMKNCGVPQDIMMEAMRLGHANGLCTREDGLGPNGIPTMRYVNPYEQLMINYKCKKPTIITEGGNG